MKDGLDQTDDFKRDDSALWDLLGNVSPQKVGPYFSRRVLRETVRLEEERGSIGRWLQRLTVLRLPHPVWSGALAAALVCVISLGVAFRDTHLPRTSSNVVLAQKDGREDLSAQDVEVIANLDNLMAYEENRIWTDESNTD